MQQERLRLHGQNRGGSGSTELELASLLQAMTNIRLIFHVCCCLFIGQLATADAVLQVLRRKDYESFELAGMYLNGYSEHGMSNLAILSLVGFIALMLLCVELLRSRTGLGQITTQVGKAGPGEAPRAQPERAMAAAAIKRN